MNLPPNAPGRLFLGTAAEFNAYLERDAALRFESAVAYVVSRPDDQSRREFLAAFSKRRPSSTVEKIRQAAWERIKTAEVSGASGFEDAVSELEDLFT